MIDGMDVGRLAVARIGFGGTIALAGLWLLGGCVATSGPTPPPGSSVTAEASPSSAPAASGPAATGSSLPPAARELTASPAPLPAGTYTVAAFTPTVALDVDGSWTSVNRFDDFFDVQQDVGSPDVVAVQVARPTGLIGGQGVTPVPLQPAEAEAIVKQNLALRPIERSESRIGGLTGRQVTIENSSGKVAGVLAVGGGTVSIDTGRRLWMAFFATPDGLVVVMVGGSVATWDHALTLAEPVLESIRIGD